MRQVSHNQLVRSYGLTLFFILFTHLPVYSQLAERVFYTDTTIDPEKSKELSLEIDNLSFFKNNEYTGLFVKGYTLPGFWLKPTLSYQIGHNIKLQAGVHALRYWGADRYPNYAYQDIANWKSNRYQKGFHILPFFRAQIAFTPNLRVVMGTLYGGSNHRLIEPLYHQELNLTADSETGFQVLHSNRFLTLDAWVNWESFIFNNDYHQEAFTVGVSATVKLNDPESRFHFYLPIQGLAQHRGGEIDTIFTNSVHTLMNGAVGAGVRWNANKKILKNIDIEADFVGYYQQKGNLWPLDSGSGIYVRSSAQLWDFKLKGAYWKSKDFISLFGSAFYGAVSTFEKYKEEAVTFDTNQMLYFGAEYSYLLGKGYAFGLDFDVYYHLPMTVRQLETSWREPGNLSYTFGAYIRLTPSLLLKKF